LRSSATATRSALTLARSASTSSRSAASASRLRATLDVSEPAVDAIVSDAAAGPTTAPKRETATR